MGHGVAVGLDAEDPGRFELRRLADVVLGPGESASGPEELCRYWTRKEAAVKATGDGIGAGLRGVITSSPTAPAVLVSYAGRPGLEARMTDLVIAGPHLAALVALTAHPIEIVQHHVDGADLAGAEPFPMIGV